MRLLIGLFSAPTGTWGGLTRGLAVAEQASRRGHEVRFTAAGPIVAALRECREVVHALPSASVLGLPQPLSRRIEQRSQHVRLPIRPGRGIGNIWFVLTFAGMARSAYLREATRAQLEVIDEFRPDVLFTDLDPVTLLSSVITQVPIAATYASVMQDGHGSLPWRAMHRAIGEVLAEHGCQRRDPHELYFDASVTKIIPSIPALDATDPARPDVRYVGHLVADLDLPASGTHHEAAPDRWRYVFVYVGTGSVTLDRIREVLPAVFPTAGPLTALVGAHSIKKVERLGGVELRPRVRTREVLPHAAWTICHAGQNTIIESLLYDVPLLCYPGPIFERRFNAEKVASAGAGRFAELDQFTPERLRGFLDDRDEFGSGGGAARRRAPRAWRTGGGRRCTPAAGRRAREVLTTASDAP